MPGSTVSGLGLRCHGLVVKITAQLHSAKPELGFRAGLNSDRSMLHVCDGESLRQWSRLETRLHP